MKIPYRFIVIDDDDVNIMYCTIVIEQVSDQSEIRTFNTPEEAFRYIRDEYSGSENPTVLFLDINMPNWSGWDFLDNFDNLDGKIKRQIRIYMLSSSIYPDDIHRAEQNRNVVGYIAKPLSEEVVTSILAQNEPWDIKEVLSIGQLHLMQL